MRILFSADWHLGYELAGPNRQARLPDQRRNLARIAAYCDEHAVDVVAVAGDVFEAQERGAARAAVDCMLETLAGPLARGLRLIAIAGNHDRDFFFETANAWLGAGGRAGQITLRTVPSLITTEARGERVNFALLPFPSVARYGLGHEEHGGTGRRNEALAKRFGEEAEALRQQAAEARLPTVALAHVTVGGTMVQAHRIAPRDDVVIPRELFPEFEMTVVGHIHRAERLGGGHFYYVGGLDRMDIGEQAYEPRVLIADIGPEGVRAVTSHPLEPTPFARVVATTEDDILDAAHSLERLDETLVKVVVAVPRDTYIAPLIAAAGRAFPRLYGNVEMAWTDEAPPRATIEGLNPAHVEETVRRYLAEQGMPDEERTALMTIVAELLAARAEAAG